jgi:hypothetical protein
MRAKHHLTVTAICPVNDTLTDVYEVTVEADRILKVEDILAAAKPFSDKKIYQEDLTNELARKLNATVRTVGYHSGVRTEVEA